MTRLAPTAPPRQRAPRERKPEHLAAVSRLPCLVCGREPVEVAHVRFADHLWWKREVGKAEKPSDCWVVPLCRYHHARQHSMNERQFYTDHGIDVLRVCSLLTLHSGQYEVMKQIVQEARNGN